MDNHQIGLRIADNTGFCFGRGFNPISPTLPMDWKLKKLWTLRYGNYRTYSKKQSGIVKAWKTLQIGGKMKRAKFIIITVCILIGTLCLCCKGNITMVHADNTANDLKVAKNLDDKDYFSVHIKNITIYIGTYEKDINLINLIGTPLSEKTTEIKKYGIYSIKQVSFEGIMFDFVQLDKDKPYFVDSITIQSSNFPTGKEIKIGDNINKAKDIYPFLPMKKGSLDTYSYSYPQNTIEFATKDEKIIRIKVYEDWP